MDSWADILFGPGDGGDHRADQHDTGAGRAGEFKQHLHARIRSVRARHARARVVDELRKRPERGKRHICRPGHRCRGHPVAELGPSEVHPYLST